MLKIVERIAAKIAKGKLILKKALKKGGKEKNSENHLKERFVGGKSKLSVPLKAVGTIIKIGNNIYINIKNINILPIIFDNLFIF